MNPLPMWLGAEASVWLLRKNGWKGRRDRWMTGGDQRRAFTVTAADN